MNNPKFFRTSTPISRRSLRKTLPCFDQISRIKRKSYGRMCEMALNSRAQTKKNSNMSKKKRSSPFLQSFNEDIDDDKYEKLENLRSFSKFNKQIKCDTSVNLSLTLKTRKVTKNNSSLFTVDCKEFHHNADVSVIHNKRISLEEPFKTVQREGSSILQYSNENSCTNLEANYFSTAKEKNLVSKLTDLNSSTKSSNIIEEFLNIDEMSKQPTHCNFSEKNCNSISVQNNNQEQQTINYYQKQHHLCNNISVENISSALTVSSDPIQQIINSEVKWDNESVQKRPNSTRVQKNPFSFLRKKGQQNLIKNKSKEINEINPENRYSMHFTKGLNNHRKSFEVIKEPCIVTRNGYKLINSGLSKDEPREDDISSGMYGGNLNVCTKRILNTSAHWTSQSLRMSLPSTHACSGDILCLKKALDDLCVRHKDILRIPKSHDCEKESGSSNPRKIVIKNKNSTQKFIPEKKLILRKKAKENIMKAKHTVTSKNASNKVHTSHSVPSFSKENKLDLIREFKEAWEDSQTKIDNSMVASKSGTSASNSLTQSQNGQMFKSPSPAQENNKTTSLCTTADEGFKKPNISKKTKPKVKKANKKISGQNKICNVERKSELLDETFYYPCTSTPLDSPERLSMPSVLQDLSPVVEERSVHKLCDITNEATLFYANRTYGKNPTNKVSREEKLWFSTFGGMSDFSNSNIKVKSILSDEINKSSTRDSSQFRRRSEEKENHSLQTNKRNISAGSRPSVDPSVKKRKDKYRNLSTAKQETKSKELAEHFEEVSKWELCIESKK